MGVAERPLPEAFPVPGRQSVMVRRRATCPMDARGPAPRSVEEILDHVRAGGPAVVALSGGVDSGVVAELAHRALGKQAFAVTLTGAAVAASEVDRARAVARKIGLPHTLVPADPLEVVEYPSEPQLPVLLLPPDRDDRVAGVGGRPGDPPDPRWGPAGRPGRRPTRARGRWTRPGRPIRSSGPGWRKGQVRSYAREAGLPNWDQPSEACLASRVPHGRPITLDLLTRIERAENELHRRGFRRVRVRTDGLDARVVVDPDEVPRLLSEPSASEVRRSVAAAGFAPWCSIPLGMPATRGPRGLDAAREDRSPAANRPSKGGSSSTRSWSPRGTSRGRSRSSSNGSRRTSGS